ncbi:unnamed protein product [Dibothriocephalus latus]|uniref:Fibronectin type-III domain-containing protein n=1 Tax=Dibothriocephalus latus TaxID=60516 RepID=A0A3P6UCE8_DIBLA|nr:unnamed protein product [Dibothriocephalus latus]
MQVDAVKTQELQVSWTIPYPALGTLRSSRAIAILNEKEVTQCSGSGWTPACVLSGLAHATEYTVFVEVCVTPKDAMSSTDSAAAWCSTTTGVLKKTLAENDNLATNVAAYALRPKSLEMRWHNPGGIVSSKALAFQGGNIVATCNGSGTPFSADSCTLNNLKDFTTYDVRVSVCVYHWWYKTQCKTSPVKHKKTLPSAPEVAKDVRVLAVNTKALQVSWTIPDLALVPEKVKDVRVRALRTQELQVSWTIPHLAEVPQTAGQVNVLAVQTQELYVSWNIPNLAGGKLASSRAIATLNKREVSQCTGTGWSPYCSLSKLAHATNYTVVVEVCFNPPDAVSSRASNTAWCSRSPGVQKQTLPQQLSVTWRNPVPTSGALASSRAIAMVGDLAQTECKPGVSAEGPAECTLSGLAHATDYTVIIEVCITPPDARSYRYSRTAWCSKTDGFRKRTLPEFPDSAKDVVVLAIQQKEFVVKWTVPDLSVGTLASSKAIASLDGEGATVTGWKVAQCSPEGSPQGQATCTLSGLSPSSKYAVSVELCFIPADVGYPLPSHSDWCSISGPVSKQTLPQFPEKATSVIVQAVQGHALTVSWINPNSAYGTVVSAKATARLRKQTAEAANCTISDAKPGPATCVLSGLEDFTQYEVFVQVCISPEDAVHWKGLRSDWCSVSAPVQKQTLPGVPDSAVGVKVHSPSRNVLAVDWTNPSASHGVLASSTAFAMLNNSTKSSCSGKLDAALRTSCNITGLEDFTNYSVAVHVCVFPVQFEPGYWSGGGCSTTTPFLKQTLPGGPDMACRTAVFARQRKSLEVSWINPDATHGPLANSTAIGFLRGSRVASCQADILPGQPVRCTLTNLLNFEEYNVSVEVCVAPVQAGSNEFVGGGCSVTPTISGTTLPGVFDAVHLEELSRQIPNSTQIVEDPSTQISIKVALSSLPTEQVGPVSYVTAYIESPSQTDGTWTRNRRYAGRLSFLSGSYNNKTWEPWEVMARNFQGDSPKKVEDFFFTVGQPSDTQTCDHCYNGPLKPDTIYRVGVRVYTNSGAGTTELSEFKTAPAPVNIALVVGIILAFLVILVVIALAVHFFMRQRGPDPKSPLPINFAEFNLNVKRMQSDAEATKEFLALANLTKKQNLEYELTEDLAATVPKLNRYGDMTPCKSVLQRVPAGRTVYVLLASIG